MISLISALTLLPLFNFVQNAAKDPDRYLVARMGARIDCDRISTPNPLLSGAVRRKSAALLFGASPRILINLQTNGYDGSMLNGLNILPSYTDYFNLNAATTGLNTSSVFIGAIIGPLVSGIITDKYGRRPAIFWGSIILLVGILLQTAAQNIAMFVVARIILGFGNALSGIAAQVYLSETFSSRYRAWGVGLLNDFYYVGALIAAGITLGTGTWQSTWAWRLPSLFQGIFTILCLLVLPFIPESPRWLVSQGLMEEARIAVAQTNASGNETDPVVLAVYKEIVDTLRWEKENHGMSFKQIVKDKVARKRLLIGGSVGPFSCIAGNIIASYYLGDELVRAYINSSERSLIFVGHGRHYRFGISTQGCKYNALTDHVLSSLDC